MDQVVRAVSCAHYTLRIAFDGLEILIRSGSFKGAEKSRIIITGVMAYPYHCSARTRWGQVLGSIWSFVGSYRLSH